MSEEIGVNVVAGKSKGEAAETLAEAMVGLTDTFETMLEDIRSPAAEFPVRQGYDKFREDTSVFLGELQIHGLRLSENIKSGASAAAKNDYDASEDFQGAWPGLSRSVNG
ncbi:hypothetical protein HNR23_000695 [Nocardiopsis mwathae]|uniref:Uncharacterized protein n=1 Tax=Nocardiopsis mwathae TaxID=1472723 RepID=A0A7W9YEC8_9ACTN|nr:hypothetical protein [Nocardiopsis mwathae]MBB6170635.1 hypothetical protein [Nocardiopsis mwathae]